MDFEFETKRTGLANAFAAAGADLLAYMGVGAALAAIPDTEPQQYAVAGTLGMIGKMMPADERLLSSPAAGEEQTGELTDEQIIETMAKYSRFLEPGLYSQTDFDCPEDMIGFARAIERAAIAAHLAREPKAEQPLWDDNGEPWNEAAENVDRERHLARQAQAEPEGWKLVPVEPTDEMIVALDESGNDEDTPRDAYRVAYRAMLNAAPVAPAGAQNAEAIRNQALEEAEDAVDKVMSEADDSGESAEAVGAYRCLKAIQALRIANGGSRV